MFVHSRDTNAFSKCLLLKYNQINKFSQTSKGSCWNPNKYSCVSCAWSSDNPHVTTHTLCCLLVTSDNNISPEQILLSMWAGGAHREDWGSICCWCVGAGPCHNCCHCLRAGASFFLCFFSILCSDQALGRHQIWAAAATATLYKQSSLTFTLISAASCGAWAVTCNLLITPSAPLYCWLVHISLI